MLDISEPGQLAGAIEQALAPDSELLQAIDEYGATVTPYLDGKSAPRVLDATESMLMSDWRDKKPLNIWRNLKMRRQLNYFGLALHRPQLLIAGNNLANPGHRPNHNAHEAQYNAQRDETELAREQYRPSDGAHEQSREEYQRHVDHGHDGDGRGIPLYVLVGVSNVVVIVIVVVVMKSLLLEFGCHTLHWRSIIGRIGSGWDTHEGGRRSYSKGVTWVMLGLGEMAGTG